MNDDELGGGAGQRHIEPGEPYLAHESGGLHHHDSVELQALYVGHSHGAVIVSSALAALERRYPSRLFGVMLDRSVALYDRPATEMPQHVPLLNVFQLNEGWHGDVIDQPNITNADASWETAPADPRAGDETIVPVGHQTLDDSPGVQRGIVDRVMAWTQ